MKFIKKILVVVLVFVVIGTGLYWSHAQGYLKNTPLAKISLPKNIGGLDNKFFEENKIKSLISQEQIQDFANDASNQTKTLTQKAGEVGSHAQKILGDSIQSADMTEANETSADSSKPLHEKTLEYARYLYCKQVVEDFEKK